VAAEQAEEEPESPETTHFSVVDADGNAVACTYTQSASFGAKVMVSGTGILLGNAMGGFSPTGVNVLAPKKRMASSMTPTIVTQNKALVLILGSPGGDTIPNTVAQVLRNVVDWGMTIDEAVMYPRVHHQYLPDVVRVERERPPSTEVLADLLRRGHKISLVAAPLGDTNDILVDAATGTAWGVADPRGGGTAEGIDRVLEHDEDRPPAPSRSPLPRAP
jgi:gamma-glutamyltranspeptidase/glutathione hydrolase